MAASAQAVAIKEPPVNNLSGSCCNKLYFVPPTITMLISFIGIALAGIYTTPYLMIPFGVGVLSSIYMCFLAHQFRVMKSWEAQLDFLSLQNDRLHQRNQELTQIVARLEAFAKTLQSQIDALQEGITRLQSELQTLRAENDRLSASNSRLEGQLTQLQSTNSSLTETSTALQQEVTTLNAAHSQVTQKLQTTQALYSQELNRLSLLNAALKGMQDTNAATFASTISALTQQITAFSQQNTTLTSSSGSSQQTSAQLSETAQLLSGVLDKVNAWQSEGTRGKLIAELDQYSALSAKIHEQVGAASAQVAVLTQEADSLRKQVQLLQQIREDFTKGLAQFQSSLAQLGDHTSDLGNVKDIFQNLVSKTQFAFKAAGPAAFRDLALSDWKTGDVPPTSMSTVANA